MIRCADRHADDPLELWAGIECSVIRLGDAYHDQLERTGHATRPEDLEQIADLGVRALRYPILWERIAPDGLERADWAWADERLGRLRALGVRPIVGLVHHGSGPRHTDLLDPSFAEGLAAFAGAVAGRFPWVEDYTPVNEPLTTARFSGLYGHWYPHGRDPRAFARALLNQCRAVALAMRAVRAVNPAARLVQTEDLGRTHSTPALSYQAEHENERRWLAFDLLCGRVGRAHPLWHYLGWLGVPERELGWFLDNPCPPDVLGINHYLTSERFLDDRLERYPPCSHGGNGRHAYADVEAVRVLAEGLAGPGTLLRDAWDRYRLPLAVTEAHLGCTREEQLRWFLEVWGVARGLRREGVDVRAVTAWAVLGSFDWDRLVTRPAGYYEPGAFDLRAPRPRPTALAGLLRDLAAGRDPAHPALDAPGWWRRPERLLYPPAYGPAATTSAESPLAGRGRRARPIVIFGGAGALGRAFTRLCGRRGLPCRPLSRREAEITNPAAVAEALDGLRPWAVVNAAGLARVDDAEREPDRCRLANAIGPAVLADACARRGIALVVFSSDQVFGGDRRVPYLEDGPVGPLNAYGRSQVVMESLVRWILPAALVVRTAALFGPWDGQDFVTAALRLLAAGQHIVAAEDVAVSPTYAPDLVHAVLDLLIDGEGGVWHLANPGAVSWAGLARRAAELAGLDPSGVEGRPAGALGLAAPRPVYSVLGSGRGELLPPLEDALLRHLRDGEVPWAAGRGAPPVEMPTFAPAPGGGRGACPEADLASR